MTKADAKKIVLLLKTIYPHSKESNGEHTEAMWCLVLRHYDYEDVRNSVAEWAANSTFYPRPAELLTGLDPTTPDAPELPPKGELTHEEEMAYLRKTLDKILQQPITERKQNNVVKL